MRPFAAVIFDMDGVIVDSEPRHERAFLDVFADLGYGDRHGIRFSDYFGRSDRALWVDFVAQHRPLQSLEELIDRKQARFLELLARDQPIFPGIPELLERLAGTTRLAVASGSSHVTIRAVLALQDLRRHFPTVVSSEDVAQGKPAPDIFLRAAAGLGVAPQDCVVVEDSAAGVTAGKAAGMRVIAVTHSLPASALGAADRVVDSIAAVTDLLLPPAPRWPGR